MNRFVSALTCVMFPGAGRKKDVVRQVPGSDRGESKGSQPAKFL